MDGGMSLAYSIRSPRLTIDKAVEDIGRNEFLHELIYVGCSHVTKRDLSIIWPVLQHWSFAENLLEETIDEKLLRFTVYFTVTINFVWFFKNETSQNLIVPRINGILEWYLLFPTFKFPITHFIICRVWNLVDWRVQNPHCHAFIQKQNYFSYLKYMVSVLKIVIFIHYDITLSGYLRKVLMNIYSQYAYDIMNAEFVYKQSTKHCLKANKIGHLMSHMTLFACSISIGIETGIVYNSSMFYL